MHFIWHAVKDSLILFPFLFISYIIIEIIESASAKNLEHSKFLSGKFSNIFASGFGLIPQCGFSVVATDLFSSHKIKIGTLLAVYISTSDEALPLLLLNPEKAKFLAPLLLIKFILALSIGYLVDLIFRKANNKRLNLSTIEKQAESNEHNHEHDHDGQTHQNHEETHTQDLSHNQESIHGCCGHHIDTSQSKSAQITKQYLLHPLLHSLKIFLYILVFNLIFSGLVELVGEDQLVSFLQGSRNFAPLFASLVGLIPNCASSVILTTLFIEGGLSFGALVGGLITNAGIGLVILFKQNKNIKENLSILSILLGVSIIVGYVIQLIGF